MKKDQIKYLKSAGCLWDVNGGLIFNGRSELLFRYWEKYLHTIFKSHDYNVFKFAPIIGFDTLKRTNYINNFPENIFVAHGLEKDKHAKVISPASCFHLYSHLKDTKIKPSGYSALVQSMCARNENGKWKYPFRLSSFTMFELVEMGDQSLIDEKIETIKALIESKFNGLGLLGNFVLANDSFYEGQLSGANVIQKLRETKREYIVKLESKTSIAMASLNKHGDFFGRNFNIKIEDESYISSFCLAFGLERLTVYSLLLWGSDPNSWPKEIKI